VLITSVQGVAQPVDNAKPATGTITLTVAVNDVEATKIVFAAQFGTIWLSKEQANLPQTTPSPIDRSKVYQ
jgi:pilus assembly protein CpaB